MTVTQKVVLIALLVLGGICVVVGFSLMHYIGGFLRTVEEEAREQEEDRAVPSAPEQQADPKGNTAQCEQPTDG